MKTALVTTTIKVPEFLSGYCKNALYYGHDIKIFIIGDKKTPKEAKRYCLALPLPVMYLGIEEQEKRLKSYPALLQTMPYNCGDRKLLGMLIAYLEGFDTIIAVDDDNFCRSIDYFDSHSIAGQDIFLPIVKSTLGWFNICGYLEANIPFYPRGFPWSKRVELSPSEDKKGKGKVIVNAGLWFGSPDVDAITNLYCPPIVTDFNFGTPNHIGLHPGTWCVFNNQNTAFAREVLPAYFCPPTAKRYSDIFPAYVVCRIAEHLGHIVSFGEPATNHIRNPHNLWKDLENEIQGAQEVEELIRQLRLTILTQNNYHDCLGEIIHQLKPAAPMIADFIEGMRVWHNVFESLPTN